MQKIIQEIKNYNWQRLISDLTVALLATALSFLLERVKSGNVGDLGAGATSAIAVTANWGKRILC